MIFKNIRKEFLFILLFPIAGFILGSFTDPMIALISLAIFQLIDTGHIYTTFLRTYLDKEEMFYNFNKVFITSIFIAIVVALWFYYQIPYFWSLFLYSGFYHFYKQNYGIFSWYENKDFNDNKNRNLFKLVMLLPAATFHFNPNQKFFFFSHHDLLRFPHDITYNVLLVLSIFVYLLFLYKIKNGKYSFFYGAFIGLIYCVSYLGVAQTEGQIFYPLAFSHGSIYLMMMHKSLNKLNRKNIVRNILVLVLIGTIFEFYIEKNFLSNSFDYYLINKEKLSTCIFIGVFFIPTFGHYIFDGWIWKSNNKIGKKIKERILNE